MHVRVHYPLLPQVHALRTAPTPRLHGQFLLTPTLTLRLMLLDQQLRADLESKNGKGGAAAGAKGAAEAVRRRAESRAAQKLAACILREPFLRVPEATSLDPASAAAPAQPGAIAALAAASSGAAAAAGAAATVGRGTSTRVVGSEHQPVAGAAAGAGDASSDACLQAGLPAIRQQLAHSLEFDVAFLRANGVVNSAGGVCGLGGLTTHLFWAEPANFVLARLLNDGERERLFENFELY